MSIAPLCRPTHKLRDGSLVNHWHNLKRSCPNPEHRRDITRAYMRIRINDGSVADLLRVVMAVPPSDRPQPAETWIPDWKQKPLRLPR